MTDKPPTRRRHDADTTTDRDVVSPIVAAERLGITPDAVRARLRRGTLSGERVEGDWHVFLPRDTTPRDDRHDADTTATVDRHDSDTTRPDRTEELIAAQREEIHYLREQLDHSRRELATERERFDIIHREALGRIQALTDGLAEAEAQFHAEAAHKADPAPGDAPESAQDGPGATEAEDRHPESFAGPSEPEKPSRQSWWRRLLYGG